MKEIPEEWIGDNLLMI